MNPPGSQSMMSTAGMPAALSARWSSRTLGPICCTNAPQRWAAAIRHRVCTRAPACIHEFCSIGNRAPLPVGIPRDDHVGHLDRAALALLPGREPLEGDLIGQFVEMLFDEVLLAFHAVAAANPRADAADVFQVAQGPLGVEVGGAV